MVQQSREAVLRSVIEAGFDAALDGGRWPELLHRLTEAGGGIGSLFVGVSFSEPERGFIVGCGLDMALSERFMTVHQDNPWPRWLMRVPSGRALDVEAVDCGHGLSETAHCLGIGTGTVRAHLKQVYAKTGVHRQSSLARLFSRCGLLDLDGAP